MTFHATYTHRDNQGGRKGGNSPRPDPLSHVIVAPDRDAAYAELGRRVGVHRRAHYRLTRAVGTRPKDTSGAFRA